MLLHISPAIAQEKPSSFEPSPGEFLNSCASCHGTSGKGAGFLTKLFKGVDPGDLTQLAKKNGGVFPFDKVLEVIDGRFEVAAHGKRTMPVWGDRYMAQAMKHYENKEINTVRVRNRILELVYFVQSIQQR